MIQNKLTPNIKPLVSMREIEHLLGRSRDSLEKLAARAGRFYRPFDRRPAGSTGKWRHIDNPVGELKEVQSRILRGVLSRATLPKSMLGGRSGKTILDNAFIHLAAPYLLTFDLRSCFPRTHDRRVFDALVAKLGCSTEIAGLLTKLTTFQHRLPQGAPTSSMLANLTLVDLYSDLEGLIARSGLSLSFWVDDIAISGGDGIREIIDPALRLVGKHGHSAPRSKLKFMPNHTPQRLTGVEVNSKPSFGQTRLEEIERLIFNMAERDVIFDDELKTIAGKIGFVEYLNDGQGRLLRRLCERLLPTAGIQRPSQRRDQRCACKRTRRHRIEHQLRGANGSIWRERA